MGDAFNDTHLFFPAGQITAVGGGVLHSKRTVNFLLPQHHSPDRTGGCMTTIILSQTCNVNLHPVGLPGLGWEMPEDWGVEAGEGRALSRI